MVKVGDKVRYVGMGGDSYDVLKKGKAYEVIALSTTMKDWIYVRSDKESEYSGSNASEKIVQPFTYLAESQYEVIESEDKPNPNVKVGDKIKVVDACLTGGRYRNGDILTVKQVWNTGIRVNEFDRPCLVNIEFEVIKTPSIQKGDTVKLIDKFYKHEAFTELERDHRKDISKQAGKELKVTLFFAGRVCYTAQNQGIKNIPVELLEKVEAKELPKEQPKAGDLFKIVDNSHGCHCFEIGAIVKFVEVQLGEYEVKGYSNTRTRIVNQIVYKEDVEPHKEPKPGDLFKVVGKGNNYHHFELGEIVEFLNVDPSGMFELRGYIKNRGEVGDQILYKSDLEPYTQHRYTDEQIAEAEQIIGKIAASLPDWDNYAFSMIGRRTVMYVNNRTTNEPAICRETDEYNQTIGRMIALCKHTGYKLPDWL